MCELCDERDSPKGVRVSDLLRDPEALVCDKIAARILSLDNHKTLGQWRTTGRYASLSWRTIGTRSVRYLIGDLVAFRDRNIHSHQPPAGR